MKNSLIFGIIALLLLAACAQTEKVKPYKFGAVLTLTGPQAFYGDLARAGIELAMEDINKAGGINGRPVQIIYEDTAGDKAKATIAAQKLAEVDNVDALFTILSSMGGAVAPIAESNKIPFIYASGTNTFAENKTYVFKDYSDATVMCELLMKQAKKDGHEKVAMFGVSGEQALLCKKGAEKIDKFTQFETYNPGDTDYRAQFTKIKDKATSVFLYSLSADCPNAYKQMRELGIGSQLYIVAFQFACGSKDATKAGEDLLENAYGTDLAVSEDSVDPAFLELKKRLEEKGWTTQMAGSAMMYDSVMEMAKAYHDCQDTLCATNNLRNLNNFKGVSGMISYNGDQIVEREVMLAHFEDGKWRKVE